MGRASYTNVFISGRVNSTRLMPPVADFSASVVSGTLPLTVNFTDTSTNTPTSWAWDFTNDGTTDSTSQNPSYTYITAGTYSVKLTVSNDDGSNSITKTGFITVTVAAPVADFNTSPLTGKIPLTVNFTDTSTNTPTSWAWDFTNDGSTDSTSQNPSYTYNTVGTYSVKLTSTNAGGSGTTIKTNLITAESPVSNLEYSVYFDGVGDYLSVEAASSATAFTFTGDFTIEGWMYFTNVDKSSPQSLFGMQSGINYFDVRWYTNRWQISTNGSGGTNIGATPAPKQNEWTHVAAVRSGGTIKLYVNGVQTSSSISNSSTLGYANSIPTIGSSGSANLFLGYLSGVRVINGTALYTSNFTPTSYVLTPTANTSLIACQNANIIDESNNNFTITVSNGDAIRANLAPNSQIGYWSGYFDGTGDIVTIPDNDAFAFGTGNFTVEYWISPQGSGDRWIVGQWEDSGTLDTNSSFTMGISSTNQFYGVIAYSNSTSQFNVTSSVISPNNTWHHVALVRNTNTITLYVNGVAVGSSTTIGSSTVNNSNLPMRIGSRDGNVNYYTGYISNLRIVKGTAVYTSNFTVPSIPLSKIANTQLLTFQSMKMVDNSDNNFAITAVGNSENRPTSIINYDSGYYSNYFDGTGDYLSVNYASNSTIPGDFTWETWVYDTGVRAYATLSAWRNAAGTGWAGWIIQRNNGANNLTVTINGTNTINQTSGTYSKNAWNHVALVRSGTAVTLYVNGVNSGTATVTGSFDPGTSYWIGSDPFNNIATVQFGGYISNQRFVNGTAVYTSNFTPSATPLTAISGTSLLTCQNYGFKDNSTNNVAITRNGDVALKAVNPFNSNYALSPQTWSHNFNGSSYVLTNSTAFPAGTSNWTVEAFIHVISTSTQQMVYHYYCTTRDSISILANGTQKLITCTFRALNVDITLTSASNTITLKKWHHIVLTRIDPTTVRMYIDGVIAATQTISSAASLNDTAMFTGSPSIGAKQNAVGQYFTGYISNLRHVVGTAVYTDTTFTPPAAALTPITGTKILACQTPFVESLAIENVVVPTDFTTKPKPVTPFLLNN